MSEPGAVERLRGVPLMAPMDDSALQLCAELAITPGEFRPDRAGIDMNLLGGDDDANAYLLAVSSVLAQAYAAAR